MNEVRSTAELRRHWFQQIVQGGDKLLDDKASLAAPLRPFFVAALTEHLPRLLGDPERDREEVVAVLRLLGVARFVVKPEDAPALIELARTAREVRGPGSQYVEEAALEALTEIADETVLPFLAECFRYSRPRDGSAGQRRRIVLKPIATIALLSRNEEALALLDEALTHRTSRVRLAACRAIRWVFSMARTGLPSGLEKRLRQVARNDPSGDVQTCAKLALEDSGAGWGEVLW